MTHRRYRELTAIAVQQGRHVETVVLAALTLVVLLSSGGAVVLDKLLEDNTREAGDLYWVYLPLFITIFACIAALASRSVLAPNPGYEGDPPVNPLTGVPLDLDEVCMQNAARENNNRKRGLMYGWLGIMLGVVNFTQWVLPHEDGFELAERWRDWCLDHSLPAALLLIFGGHVIGRLSSSAARHTNRLIDQGSILDLEGQRTFRLTSISAWSRTRRPESAAAGADDEPRGPSVADERERGVSAQQPVPTASDVGSQGDPNNSDGDASAERQPTSE